MKKKKENKNSEYWYKQVEKNVLLFKARKMAFNIICLVCATVCLLISVVNQNKMLMIICFSVMFVQAAGKLFFDLLDERMDSRLGYFIFAGYNIITSLCCILSVSGIFPFTKYFIIVYFLFGRVIFSNKATGSNHLLVDLSDWSSMKTISPITDMLIVTFVTLAIYPILSCVDIMRYSIDDEINYLNEKQFKHKKYLNSSEYKEMKRLEEEERNNENLKSQASQIDTLQTTQAEEILKPVAKVETLKEDIDNLQEKQVTDSNDDKK